MINKPPPLKGLNIRSLVYPDFQEGVISHGSGLVLQDFLVMHVGNAVTRGQCRV